MTTRSGLILEKHLMVGGHKKRERGKADAVFSLGR